MAIMQYPVSMSSKVTLRCRQGCGLNPGFVSRLHCFYMTLESMAIYQPSSFAQPFFFSIILFQFVAGSFRVLVVECFWIAPSAKVPQVEWTKTTFWFSVSLLSFCLRG